MRIENTGSGLRIYYSMHHALRHMGMVAELCKRAKEEQESPRQIRPVTEKKTTPAHLATLGQALNNAHAVRQSLLTSAWKRDRLWGYVVAMIHRFGYYRKEEAMDQMDRFVRRCVEPIWEQLCHAPEEMGWLAFRQAWEAEWEKDKPVPLYDREKWQAAQEKMRQAKGEDTVETKTKHKYKAGDKVRIVKEWPEDGSAHQNEGGMNKWLGKTMTIKGILSTTVPAYMMQEDQGERRGFGWAWWESAIEGLAEDPAEQERIVITREGNITLARLFRGRKLIHRAEAICSPKDVYDFAAGADLAYDRLMEKVDEERMEAERIKEGDKVKVIGNKTFRHHFEIGELVTVFKQGSGAMWLCENQAGLIQAVDPEDVVKEAAR